MKICDFVWRYVKRENDMFRRVLLLTLGTGVGGAAIVDGRLIRGHLGRAGHFGHVSLDPSGLPDIVAMPGSLEDAIVLHAGEQKEIPMVEAMPTI